MKRNPILYVLLAILIAQPLLVIGFGPSMATNAIDAEDTVIPAQGTRLSTHTNHVPIIINDNADFGLQGWPGTGTPADPYVLSGLNITYDLGVPAIQVYNVDVSFVIRDCYLNQGSEDWAVEFINTTAATIEYTTIYGNGGGIYCDNANNTEIMHSFVENYGDSGSTTYRALLIEYSDSCSLVGNEFNSPNDTSAVFSYSHNIDSQDNTYASDGSSMVHLLFTACNSTSMDQDTITYGGISVSFFGCHDLVLTDLNIYDVLDGIYASDCPGISITGTSISATNNLGVRLLGCNNAVISDCTIDAPAIVNGIIYTTTSEWLTVTGNTLSGSDNFGILLSGAHNSTVTTNTITDISLAGIYLADSHDCEVSSNTVSVCNTYGIQLATSHRVDLDGNVISDIDGDGVYFELSDNGTVSNSIIDTVTDEGIELDTCSNWQVHDNTIAHAGVGIYLYQGAFTDIWSNDISDIDSEGISANTHDVLETWENTVTNADVGLYFTDCDDLYIRDETVSDCVTGIFVDQSEESEFSNNVITDCTDRGFDIWQLANTSFIQNTLTNCVPYGFEIEYSTNLTFTGNVLTGGGFYFSVEASLSDVNHTFSGNTVNDLPLYYGIGVENIDIDGTSYGQIILANSSEVEITGGSFINSATIYFHNCENVNVSGVTITDHIFGVAIIDCENVTVRNSDITGNYDWSNVGILAVSSDWFTAENVDITTSEVGIVVGSSHYAIIDSCILSDSPELIYAENSDGGTIVDCDIFDAIAVGIGLDSSENWTVTNNHIYWCEMGIETDTADYMNLTLNEIHDCWVGIWWQNTAFGLAYNNTIRWNDGGVIMITPNPGSMLYSNILALNFIDNGFDDGVPNNWDDWISVGNYWDDYSGTGTYSVPGSAGSVDNFPMQYIVTEPIINEAFDEDYAEGTTGHEAIWYAYDDYLNDYTVTIDGAFWTSGVVNDLQFPEINVNIDGLSYGEHTAVITVWDVDLNSVSDTILIDVFDIVDPTVDNPANFEIFLGVTGNEIIWEADDLNPGNYVVMIDDSEYATGPWTSGTISIDIDGLSAGVHHFTMTVYDADENSASDSVSILVINDATAPIIDSPEDIVFVVDTTGNRIIWTPTDDYPDSFEVSFNGTVIAADSWGGGHIVLELDNLVVGEYNFTMTVFDGGQHSASDTVAVQVIPYEGWTPVLPPPDFTLLIIAGVGVTGAVVIIGVIYVLKIKKPSSGGA